MASVFFVDSHLLVPGRSNLDFNRRTDDVVSDSRSLRETGEHDLILSETEETEVTERIPPLSLFTPVPSVPGHKVQVP